MRTDLSDMNLEEMRDLMRRMATSHLSRFPRFIEHQDRKIARWAVEAYEAQQTATTEGERRRARSAEIRAHQSYLSSMHTTNTRILEPEGSGMERQQLRSVGRPSEIESVVRKNLFKAAKKTTGVMVAENLLTMLSGGAFPPGTASTVYGIFKCGMAIWNGKWPEIVATCVAAPLGIPLAEEIQALLDYFTADPVEANKFGDWIFTNNMTPNNPEAIRSEALRIISSHNPNVQHSTTRGMGSSSRSSRSDLFASSRSTFDSREYLAARERGQRYLQSASRSASRTYGR